MITVIDMAAGELIYSSTAKSIDAPLEREKEVCYPMLALQEVEATTEKDISMPPELADCPANKFLKKFD